MRWQPGMNLSGLLNACNEMLAEPLPFEWSNQTPRFLLIFTGLREKIERAAPPRCFKGVAISLVTAGLLSLAFMGFSGLVK